MGTDDMELLHEAINSLRVATGNDNVAIDDKTDKSVCINGVEFCCEIEKKAMAMTFEELQRLIADDENIHLELKKTTGELKDGMHTACAFLNGAGGWLIFGVAPKSLKILGPYESSRRITTGVNGPSRT